MHRPLADTGRNPDLPKRVTCPRHTAMTRPSQPSHTPHTTPHMKDTRTVSNPTATATVTALDEMIAGAAPVRTSAGRATGDRAATISKTGMNRELTGHRAHKDAVEVLGAFRTVARGNSGIKGILTSAGHNAITFYLLRCPQCSETIACGPDKGKTRPFTLIAAGRGEANRYLYGDGTEDASVTEPLGDPGLTAADAREWSDQLLKLGVPQTRKG